MERAGEEFELELEQVPMEPKVHAMHWAASLPSLPPPLNARGERNYGQMGK